MDSEIEVNENGGKQSKIGCRLDLTPPIAMRIVGKVLKKGEHYGEGNWRKIPAKDHLNHAMDHIYAFLAELVLSGNFSDEDADNATCRILMWREMLELERQKQPPKKEE